MVAANVCKHLDRRRFDPLVLFFYQSTGSMPEILNNLGVESHGLEIMRRHIFIRPFIVASALNRLGIDILHVHHVPLYNRVANGLKLSRVKGVVLTEHAKYSISRSGRLQQASRRAAGSVNFFTTVSSNLKNFFTAELGIPEQSIQVIHNGIDTRRFAPGKGGDTLRSIIPRRRYDKILINVGRLAEAKDHFTLLLMMKKLVQKDSNVILVLIGDGELRPAIEQKIEELSLENHVFLLGSRADVDDLMHQADLFVLSSKREGLPMVVLEAMASGLPVVSTDVGGISEVVRNSENGALVPPENPDRLAEAVQRILSDPKLSGHMGTSARDWIVRHYSLDNITKKYAALYRLILDTAANPCPRQSRPE